MYHHQQAKLLIRVVAAFSIIGFNVFVLFEIIPTKSVAYYVHTKTIATTYIYSLFILLILLKIDKFEFW